MKAPIIIGSVICALLTPFLANAANANPKSIVNKKAAIIKKMHSKAKKALVNAAQDKSYASYMMASKDKRHEHEDSINKVSLHVQSKFHVAEMCLIDANGPELARIVGKEIAHDLSPDESGAGFFKPGFATKAKKTYTSDIYMSPDANKWVVAYISPIVIDGANKAILHYEHGVDVYQKAMNKKLSGNTSFLLAVSKEGYVISDSRSAIDVNIKGDSDQQSDYFTKFEFGGLSLDAVTKAAKSGSAIKGDDGKSYNASVKSAGKWTLIALSAI